MPTSLTPPNVLLVRTDQHQGAALSCAGSSVVRLPYSRQRRKKRLR